MNTHFKLQLMEALEISAMALASESLPTAAAVRGPARCFPEGTLRWGRTTRRRPSDASREA